MVSPSTYILSAAALAALVISLGFTAVRLRSRLLPSWDGAPAHLVDAVLGIALLIWLAELLGSIGLLYAPSLVAASLLAALAANWRLPAPTISPAGGAAGGAAPEEASATAGGGGSPAATGPASHNGLSNSGTGPTATSALSMLITVGVIAVVFAHWGLTAKDALGRGIFNFDSLWYHMPFAVEMAHSHSVTGLQYPETVYVNWAFPQNSELLHAVGILLTGRDTLSLFLNFGWLGIAFLAAWCIGRPYGRGPLTVAAAAIVLECHTLVVREPGAAKNDLMAAALILAAIAILLNAWAQRASRDPRAQRPQGTLSTRRGSVGARGLEAGWPLAVAGLTVGLAAGTKFTALAMAAALTVAVVALAPPGRRRAAAAWWFLPALAAGGFWYLRNLIVAGNPLPEVTHLGPIALPHPERLQSARPNFSIAHYATDTAVWREYFAPGLHQAFGLLWPLVAAAAVAGALLALLRGRDRAVRWIGAAAIFGMLAYLVTPFTAAGAEGAPVGFAINIRYALPALLAGLVLLPLAPALGRPTDVPVIDRRHGWSIPGTSGFGARSGEWILLGALLLTMLVTDRSDAVLRDPSRLFGVGLATLFVVLPAALLFWQRHRTAVRPRWSIAVPAVALVLAVLAIGYRVERGYLRDRFGPGSEIPGMHLDSAYVWANHIHDARIGLAGTTAGFLQYGFYGADLSNQVRYIGAKGPHGAFNAVPDCRGFRAAVNAAHLGYLVTAPFLNFIHPDRPIASPEAAWLRGEAAVAPLLRSGPVTVWKVRGRLHPGACGPVNAPLRRIPQQPGA